MNGARKERRTRKTKHVCDRNQKKSAAECDKKWRKENKKWKKENETMDK